MRIYVFVETVDSSPARVDEPLTEEQGSVGTGHEGVVVAVDFVERTVVHLVERQPVLGLDSDPASERIPETHISGGEQSLPGKGFCYLWPSIAGSPAILL